jgi:hypothetical protein
MLGLMGFQNLAFCVPVLLRYLTRGVAGLTNIEKTRKLAACIIAKISAKHCVVYSVRTCCDSRVASIQRLTGAMVAPSQLISVPSNRAYLERFTSFPTQIQDVTLIFRLHRHLPHPGRRPDALGVLRIIALQASMQAFSHRQKET